MTSANSIFETLANELLPEDDENRKHLMVVSVDIGALKNVQASFES